MRFKLTYQIGLATVQEWIFTSKSLSLLEEDGLTRNRQI
jgi:hypothetical protein